VFSCTHLLFVVIPGQALFPPLLRNQPLSDTAFSPLCFVCATPVSVFPPSPVLRPFLVFRPSPNGPLLTASSERRLTNLSYSASCRVLPHSTLLVLDFYAVTINPLCASDYLDFLVASALLSPPSAVSPFPLFQSRAILSSPPFKVPLILLLCTTCFLNNTP